MGPWNGASDVQAEAQARISKPMEGFTFGCKSIKRAYT